MLLVIMEHFGGKFIVLGDIFHFSQSSPLVSRKVTLVALRRTTEGVMWCCPVSWNAGSSDRFDFKAKSPTHVVEFLNEPFLFLGHLICFLQDEPMKELILLVLQAKLGEVLNASACRTKRERM
jgi:hypothetical protein